MVEPFIFEGMLNGQLTIIIKLSNEIRTNKKQLWKEEIKTYRTVQ